MELTIVVQPRPTPGRATALPAMPGRASAACNAPVTRAWETRDCGQNAPLRPAGAEIRAGSGLSTRVIVRAIARVADAFKLDGGHQRPFRPRRASAHDARSLRRYATGVKIRTVDGRVRIPF